MTTGLLVLLTGCAWFASYFHPWQTTLSQNTVRLKAEANGLIPVRSYVGSSRFFEHRHGRIVFISQSVDPPPPIEIERNQFGLDITNLSVNAAPPRRIPLFASETHIDVVDLWHQSLAAHDPVMRSIGLLEWAGIALRFDSTGDGSLPTLDGKPLPPQVFGLSIPAARITQVMVPHWLILVLALVAFGESSRRLWRGRRSVRWANAGRCGGCGYDLRATPGRCPECGKAGATA